MVEMTALIWMLAWLPQVLSAMSELPPPVNLNLTSKHFSHMLKWAPAQGTPTGVYYHVAFCPQTGTSLVPVAGCEHVQHPLVCNLTEAFSDPKVVYLTQVTAQLDAQTSKKVNLPGFLPIRDTDLDLPLLTVTSRDRDLCWALKPHNEVLRKHYDLLHYQLRINSSAGTAEKTPFKSLKSGNWSSLAPGRQYCISVRFYDTLYPRVSNYSKPQCAFTTGVSTADPWISGALCFSVISVVVVLAMLFGTGFICLKTRPLPLVLITIHHTEETLLVVPWRASLSSLLNFKATLPSSGKKRSSQTSDESDGENVTESTDGSRGGGYKLRVGTNLLSASSSSSSSLSAPLSPGPVVPPILSSIPNAVFLPSDFFQPEAQKSAAGLYHTRTADTASLTDSLPESHQSPPADTDSLTVEIIDPEKEEMVNLLTLTFGRREEEEEKSHFDIFKVEPESSSTTLILPSQTVNTKEVAMETISCSDVKEEEEAELSAYMRRPFTDV